MASSFSQDPPERIEQVQVLFVRHQAVIRGFIASLVPNPADADDVLQETFLTVSRKAESFELGTNFTAWACRIARNKLLEHYRAKRRVHDLSESAMEALVEEAPGADALERQEEILRKCVEKLSPRSRDLLWRRYTGRQSSEVMAGALGITSPAVRAALTKARAFLRDCVAGELKKLET